MDRRLKENFNKIKKEIELPKKERIWFIKKWAEYVRTNPDRKWSKLQNIIINASMEEMKHPLIDVKTYLKIKGEICKR